LGQVVLQEIAEGAGSVSGDSEGGGVVLRDDGNPGLRVGRQDLAQRLQAVDAVHGEIQENPVRPVQLVG